MKLVKYDEKKHDPSGFVFNLWEPTHVAVRDGEVVAVLTRQPANSAIGSLEFQARENKGKISGRLNALRVKVDDRRGTTIISYPDTVAEANLKLTERFASS